LTLCNLLDRITLENKAPLFLQLSQHPSSEVDAIIPNTAKAELMAEKMSIQIAAWCHIYLKESNPGGKRFYQKLSDRAFGQVLLHEIGDCTWDSSLKAVTSPSAQSEMLAIAEFKQQDWVKLLSQDSETQKPTKVQVNRNVAFPFQDDFSVGTIHGANAKAATPSAEATPIATEVVVIQDDKDNVVFLFVICLLTIFTIFLLSFFLIFCLIIFINILFFIFLIILFLFLPNIITIIHVNNHTLFHCRPLRIKRHVVTDTFFWQWESSRPHCMVFNINHKSLPGNSIINPRKKFFCHFPPNYKLICINKHCPVAQNNLF
jgi:hypothetical protein